jgi:hypothetical protein
LFALGRLSITRVRTVTCADPRHAAISVSITTKCTGPCEGHQGTL